MSIDDLCRSTSPLTSHLGKGIVDMEMFCGRIYLCRHHLGLSSGMSFHNLDIIERTDRLTIVGPLEGRRSCMVGITFSRRIFSLCVVLLFGESLLGYISIVYDTSILI